MLHKHIHIWMDLDICPMLKSFRYRLYPTTEQSVLLNKHIGSSRFVYNLALETKQMAWAAYRDWETDRKSVV